MTGCDFRSITLSACTAQALGEAHDTSAMIPIFASEGKAAKLLDMRPEEFRALVDAGHFPRGREIAPGVVRWEVDMLRRIGCGDAIDGMGDIEW